MAEFVCLVHSWNLMDSFYQPVLSICPNCLFIHLHLLGAHRYFSVKSETTIK